VGLVYHPEYDQTNLFSTTTPEGIMNHYADISTNQLFSMFNRTTYAPSKKAIKAELKRRGFFSY
jgi:hypothetical protein